MTYGSQPPPWWTEGEFPPSETLGDEKMDTTTNENRHDEMEALRNVLDSSGVSEALKTGSTLQLEWEEMTVGNPNFNCKTGAEDENSYDIIDDRSEIIVVVPKISIRGPSSFSEKENEDRNEDMIDSVAEAVETAMAALERRIAVSLDDVKNRVYEYHVDVQGYEKEVVANHRTLLNRIKGGSGFLRTLLIIAAFAFGSVYGAAKPDHVIGVISWLSKLFS